MSNSTDLLNLVANLTSRIDYLESEIKSTQINLDFGWVLISGYLVFFMKTGFAMLEAGGVRLVNAVTILLKNVMDTAIGGLVWYLWGFGFAFGDVPPAEGAPNPFIGTRYFALSGIELSTDYDIRLWFWHFTFAVTASTIVSGAIAERTRLRAYFIFAVLLTGWIYPTVAHWQWSKDGWLSPFKRDPSTVLFANGFLDFAGDSAVHMVGGVSSFIGAWVVGPRMNRWDPKFKGHYDPGNQSFLALGALCLWFGWYGFNPGSTLSLAGGLNLTAGRIATNTTLAACCGAIGGLALAKLVDKQWSLPTTLNGLLGGLVVITGPCAVIEPWAAVICGFLGALSYFGGSKLLIKLKVDDPLEASAVHWTGGFVGLIVVGLFAQPNYIKQAYSRPADFEVVHYGLFMGGGGAQLGMQFMGAAVIIAWVAFWATGGWLLMKIFKIVRIAEAAEKDLLSHALELAEGTTKAKVQGTELNHMKRKDLDKAPARETVVVIEDSSDSDKESSEDSKD